MCVLLLQRLHISKLVLCGSYGNGLATARTSGIARWVLRCRQPRQRAVMSRDARVLSQCALLTLSSSPQQAQACARPLLCNKGWRRCTCDEHE